mmetsp:Transcript_1595/g.5136  ORF Transcript_1595/g.5136 Transcript_1595/m.5136 type:complete len:274 (-) Transcript_1595:195-1016(-)
MCGDINYTHKGTESQHREFRQLSQGALELELACAAPDDAAPPTAGGWRRSLCDGAGRLGRIVRRPRPPRIPPVAGRLLDAEHPLVCRPRSANPPVGPCERARARLARREGGGRAGLGQGETRQLPQLLLEDKLALRASSRGRRRRLGARRQSAARPTAEMHHAVGRRERRRARILLQRGGARAQGAADNAAAVEEAGGGGGGGGGRTSEAEIVEFCRARLAHFKAPRYVVQLPGGLPKTSTGKIQKFLLRETARLAAEEEQGGAESGPERVAV